MQWLEVIISSASRGIALLEARLTALGYDSFQVDDEQEFNEFLEQNRPYWNYVDEGLMQDMTGKSQVRLYLENTASTAETLAELRAQMAAFRAQYPDAGLGTLEVTTQTLEETDWENGWKQYYHPIAVGNRLLVVPQWMDPENPEGRLPVRLDPGMMFGTGDHASTRMCLEALEQAVQGGERVLDLGTGSGILSIAALRLGAKSALGVDIDPKGEDIARENAAYNDYTPPRFQAVTGNVLELAPQTLYDLVLANIVADVILPLAPVLRRYLRPGGQFVCSGILSQRLPEVMSALTSVGLESLVTTQQDGWAMCRGVLSEAEA